jgi:DNA polymerase-1
MQERGIQIDVSYVKSGLDAELSSLAKLKEEFRLETGYEFTDSNKAFAKIFDERGERYGRTDKGNPSFTSESLESIGSGLAQKIIAIRDCEKRAGTFWSSFLYQADVGGIVRANFQQGSTTTGRFSCRSPNLQQLPSESEESDKEKRFVIRGSFIPRGGYSFASIDYQAIEYRIFLDIAGEHSLIAKVNAGEDLHQATADMMGVSRRVAKTIGFMLLYGGGIAKLAATLGVSETEARRLKELYFARLPKVKLLVNSLIRTAEQRGYVYNFLGRRFWLNDFNFSYKIPNAFIQGTAADIMKRAMVEIDAAAMHDTHLIATIHDELVFEIPDVHEGNITKIKQLMESVYTPYNGLPMKAEASVSTKSLAKRDMTDFVC